MSKSDDSIKKLWRYLKVIAKEDRDTEGQYQLSLFADNIRKEESGKKPIEKLRTSAWVRKPTESMIVEILMLHDPMDASVTAKNIIDALVNQDRNS